VLAGWKIVITQNYTSTIDLPCNLEAERKLSVMELTEQAGRLLCHFEENLSFSYCDGENGQF
jgi:hypothetical protein